jgi:hypothetical protein
MTRRVEGNGIVLGLQWLVVFQVKRIGFLQVFGQEQSCIASQDGAGVACGMVGMSVGNQAEVSAA